MIGKLFVKSLSFLFTMTLLCLVLGGSIGYAVVAYYGKDLPDYTQLASYDPPTTTRFYAQDGRLIGEFAKEKRVFVPFSAIPKRVVQAFIAAEDKNFYRHPGVDLMSISRAAVQNMLHFSHQGNLVGGSTITQQVVKNFLLTKERTISRKVKEAILALRITRAFSKDKILELYLNEIYLGSRSYGVVAASLNYFNKPLDDLTIDEAAMLAALPKAPSNIDPRKYYKRALERRNWVIDRMHEEGYIRESEAHFAKQQPIRLHARAPADAVDAPAFNEAVKTEIVKHFGEQALYEQGLTVRTTLIPEYQVIAQQALRKGLEAYDQRHGYRGPLANLVTDEDWVASLKTIKRPIAMDPQWRIGIVLALHDHDAAVGLSTGERITLPFAGMSWARPWMKDQRVAASPQSPKDVLHLGDVILVGQEKSNKDQPELSWTLKQIPDINGAVVVLDPHTGRIQAMVGGYYYGEGEFNRATQAKRQPGSAFKPFVYLSALERGFTPSTIILDAPVELEQGTGLPTWKPQNYSGKFYGPSTMRRGLELSRNAMTVRLSTMIGIDPILDMIRRFGIAENPARNFSTVLGTTETTLINLTNAYGVLVNGGKAITPSLIDRIHDRHGKIIYKQDTRVCDNCQASPLVSQFDKMMLTLDPPVLEDNRKPITDPISSYQILSMMQGVVERGTAASARSLGRTLGGKTGTTNESKDTWFIGFSPNLVVGVFVGFDTPKTLGRYETGASVALPIFMDVVKKVLKDTPDIPFTIPPGVSLAKVDINTGQPPSFETPENNIIYEAFRQVPLNIPQAENISNDSTGSTPPTVPSFDSQNTTYGTGGIY